LTLAKDNVIDVLGVANRFSVEGLKVLCVNFLSRSVTVNTVCALFDSIPFAVAESKALQFIAENAVEVLATPGFTRLQPHSVLTIVKCDTLAIEEVELFKAVLQWGKAELDRQLKQSVEKSKQNLPTGSSKSTVSSSSVSSGDRAAAAMTLSASKQNSGSTADKSDSPSARITLASVLSNVIPLIRFPLMSLQEFATHVAGSGLLSPQQSLQVFSYLGLPQDKRENATMSFPCKERERSASRWQLKLVTAGQLQDKDMTYTNVGATAGDYPVAIGNVEFKRGVHCWQATINSLSGGWVAVGACQPKTSYIGKNSANFCYEDPSWWGWSQCNQLFQRGVYTTGGGVTWANGNHVHFRLDIKEGKLRTRCIENGSSGEYADLPRGLSWVPSICTMGGQLTSVTLRSITPEQFGVRVV